jgi:hypothetical protein
LLTSSFFSLSLVRLIGTDWGWPDLFCRAAVILMFSTVHAAKMF